MAENNRAVSIARKTIGVGYREHGDPTANATNLARSFPLEAGSKPRTKRGETSPRVDDRSGAIRARDWAKTTTWRNPKATELNGRMAQRGLGSRLVIRSNSPLSRAVISEGAKIVGAHRKRDTSLTRQKRVGLIHYLRKPTFKSSHENCFFSYSFRLLAIGLLLDQRSGQNDWSYYAGCHHRDWPWDA